MILKKFLRIFSTLVLTTFLTFIFMVSSVYIYFQSRQNNTLIYPANSQLRSLEYVESGSQLNNTLVQVTVPKPIFDVNQTVSELDIVTYREKLNFLPIRSEFFYQDQSTGNYLAYNTSTKLDTNVFNGFSYEDKTQIINSIKLFNYVYIKNGGFVGVEASGNILWETVDPEINWNGGISFTDSINLENAMKVQIDGISFVITEAGTVEGRLRVANNYVGSGKRVGGIFFLRVDLPSMFDKLMNSTRTVSYSIGFRDTYEKMYNIRSGINIISSNVTQQTSTSIEGKRKLGMLDLSNIIYPEIAYSNYVEGWAAGENGLGVRALGGGICAAVSGQWYLLNTLLNSNNIQYNILAHQNHLDKFLNPIPYIIGTASGVDISLTDATIYRDNYVTIDALIEIPGDVKITLKPTELLFNADGISPNRLIMVVSSEIDSSHD